MKLLNVAVPLIVCLMSASAFADDVEGLVRVVGSDLNTETLLTPEKEFTGTHLCGSDTEKRIRHLSALVIKASGQWQLKPNGDKRCLDVQSFQVTKMTSGRDAVVGTLSHKGTGYIVTSEDGKSMTLADLPDGLKKLVGTKVILDLKANNGPSAKEASNIVVTYQTFP